MKHLSPGFLLILAILLVWQVATSLGWVDAVALPPISRIFEAWGQRIVSGELPQELWPSLVRVFVGFGLATVVGILLGVLMATIPFFYRLLSPLSELVRPVPSSAYIPAAILFLGIGNEMKIFVVFLTCLFPVLLNTYSGVRGVDPVLIDTGRTFGASRMIMLSRIVLPAALASILTGMRISLGLALVVVVVAEMIAGTNGIGYFILQMQRIFQVPDMFAAIFTLGVVGYLLNLGFLRIERHLLRWRGTDAQT
jgi:NitT/TauT family transport system permease protein/sulfonate transport system permease protein